MVHSPFSFLSGSPFAPKVRTVLVGEPSSSSPWAHPKVLAPDYAANSEPQDDGVTPMATGAAPSETAPPPAPLPTPPPSAATAGTVAAAVPPSQPLSMAVGARVRTEFGDEGVVRFVGQTSFREGEWIGVELLRPKGKNDGTVQGVRYFESKPDHGLFARAHKLELLPADGSSPPVEAHAANDGMPPPANANANSPRPRNSPSGSSWPAPELRPTLRGMPGTQKATVEKGLLERLDRAASTDYGLEYSPWPERQVPAVAPPSHWRCSDVQRRAHAKIDIQMFRDAQGVGTQKLRRLRCIVMARPAPIPPHRPRLATSPTGHTYMHYVHMRSRSLPTCAGTSGLEARVGCAAQPVERCSRRGRCASRASKPATSTPGPCSPPHTARSPPAAMAHLQKAARPYRSPLPCASHAGPPHREVSTLILLHTLIVLHSHRPPLSSSTLLFARIGHAPNCRC